MNNLDWMLCGVVLTFIVLLVCFAVKSFIDDFKSTQRAMIQRAVANAISELKRDKVFRWWHIENFEDKVNEMIDERLKEQEADPNA